MKRILPGLALAAALLLAGCAAMRSLSTEVSSYGEWPAERRPGTARTSVAEYQPWDDPLWWRGGFGYWRYGPWMSPRWSLSASYSPPRYEREVALLIRDRASGKPLFETRASSEGNLRAGAEVLAAMFEAALMDFPRLGMNPRRVVVPLPQ